MSEQKKEATLKLSLSTDYGTDSTEEHRVSVEQWISILNILQGKKAKPNKEDVKRWYQLLVGISEEAMLKDIKETL